MTRMSAALSLFALAVLSAGCFGSAGGRPPRVRPSTFVITYTPAHSLGPDPPPRRLHLVCTGRRSAPCAAVIYLLTHPPGRTCLSTSFSTPAALAVTGTLRGRPVFEPVALVCGGHGPMARATRALLAFASARA